MKRIWQRLLILSTCALTLLEGPAAAGEPFHAGGHLKSLNLYLEAPPESKLESTLASSNRLRVDLTGDLPHRGSLEFSIEDILLYQDPAGLVPLPGDSPNRFFDLEKNWNQPGQTANQLFIDRLNLKWSLDQFEIIAGRQAIGFGRISLFSPLDIIAPFPPEALDTDVRPGVDALRFSHFFGMTGQWGATAIFGDRKEHNSYLGTIVGSLNGMDLLALGGMLRNRPTLGLGAATQAAGIGIKVEGTVFKGRNGDLHDHFAIAAIEGDYRFKNELILFAQYLYNGAGVDRAADYPRAIASAPFTEGLSFLGARHYLLAAPSYEMHPLVRLSALAIWNLQDDSWLLRPLCAISLSDNLSLQLFWTQTQGARPQRIASLSIPRSEFGSAGNNGGLFLKFFY